jgi:hypothetical protein
MNPGQEQFLNFILERTRADKKEEAKAMLVENFKKQAEGQFTYDDIVKFVPKMLSLLEPDRVDEVKTVIRQFAQNFRH